MNQAPVTVPQNQPPAPPAPLTFASEDEQVAALKTIRASDPTEKDIPKIDAIINAKIVPPAGTPPAAQPIIDLSVPPSALPPSPAPGAEPAPQHVGRNWLITEDDIPKETFFDEETKRNRPFVTQKDPKDLFKSFINAEKRIHYLEKKRLPEAVSAAEKRVRDELTAQIAEMTKTIDALKTKDPAAPQPAAPKPGEPAGAQQPQPGLVDDIAAELAELEAINPEESLENSAEYTGKLRGVLSKALKRIQSLSQDVTGVKKIGDEFTQFRTERQAREAANRATAEADRKKREREDTMERLYKGIDTFAQSPILKEVFPSFKIDRPYKTMASDAQRFMGELGSLFYGKAQEILTPAERETATSAYLAGNPALMEKVNQYGTKAPDDFEAWVFLDLIDAVREGFMRNPDTKQWERILDPVTKQPVTLGDWDTAFGKWMDSTGKRDEMIKRGKSESALKVIAAIQKRDQGIIQPDVSKTRQAGELMSEDEAKQVLVGMDGAAILALVKNNRMDEFARVNAALTRLGGQPLNATDFQ